MTFDRGIIVRPAAGETSRELLDSSGSDSALGVVEMVLAVGSGGPPLHCPGARRRVLHPAGELTVQPGDEVLTGRPRT